MTSVKIGSVLWVGSNAFYDCNNLNDVYISDLSAWCNISFALGLDIYGSTTLSSNPLACYCNLYLKDELVTDLVIPDGITEIYPISFAGCKSIKSATIPEDVTLLYFAAFYYCDSLKSVYCKATTPPYIVCFEDSWLAFHYNASDRKIYVPAESVQAYKSADGWRDYADAIFGYDFENGVVVE